LRKLQKYTGVDFSRLAVLEKTDANLELKTIRKLTEFFKVSNTYLFGGDGFIFYYDENKQTFFSLPYEQYKSELTDDVVSVSIVDGSIRRIISIEGYDRLARLNTLYKNDIDIRLKTISYLNYIDKLDSYEFNKQKEIILEFFETKEIKKGKITK